MRIKQTTAIFLGLAIFGLALVGAGCGDGGLCDGHGVKKKWVVLMGKTIEVKVSVKSKVLEANKTASLGCADIGDDLEFVVWGKDEDTHHCQTKDEPVLNYLLPLAVEANVFVRDGSGTEKKLKNPVKLDHLDPKASEMSGERTWSEKWKIPGKAKVEGEKVPVPLKGQVLIFRFYGQIDDLDCTAPNHLTSHDSPHDLSQYSASVSLVELKMTRAFQEDKEVANSDKNAKEKDAGYAAAGSVVLKAYTDAAGQKQDFPAGEPAWTITRIGSADPPIQDNGATITPTLANGGIYKVIANCGKIQKTLFLLILKVDLDKCAADWLPKGGKTEDNITTIKSRVIPDFVKGKFKFTLYDVSHEKGFCLNAPQTIPGTGEDSDAWKDLQFPTQSGFSISGTDNDVAETTADTLSDASVTVEAFDYGAYGRIKVQFVTKDGSFSCLGKETGGNTEYTTIPLDANGNHIADCWPGDHGPGNSFAPEDDNDDTPLGNGTPGDGISRYEEYRGFVVQGAHVRLDPTKKDVFVQNVDVGDAGVSGFFTTAALTTPVRAILDSEWIPDTRVVNFNHGTAPGDDQQAIKVTAAKGGWPGGLTSASGKPYVPNRQEFCWVFVVAHKQGVQILGGDIGPNDTEIEVESTVVYAPSGVIKIENEQIAYGDKDITHFKHCIRGFAGTAVAPHKNLTKVNYWVSEEDAIKSTFAHEAGHLCNLDDDIPGNDENIMSYGWCGTLLGKGLWDTFVGKKSALTDKFVVKQ